MLKFARQSDHNSTSFSFSRYLTLPQFPPNLSIMLQRTLFRQAQAARSALATSSSTSVAPLALRRTSRSQTRLPTAIRPFAPQPFSRFYSTETKDASKEGETAESESAEDPVQKELEEKKREVIEMKV